jgi:hypothetical protein
MAYDTYAELKAAVLDDLLRTGDTNAAARFDDWLAEFEDAAKLRLNGANLGEAVALNASITGEYTELPADIISIRSVVIAANGVKTPLQAVTTDRIDADYGGLAGVPKAFAIVGASIRLGPRPDGSYPINMTFTSLPALSETRPTNWLLLAGSLVYKGGILWRAHTYYKDFAQADRYRSETLDMLDALVRTAKLNFPAGGMSPRFSGMTV